MQFIEARDFILEKLRNELPPHLSYHSVEHVQDVYRAAGHLGALEGVAGESMTLLLTAALYHDTGFLRGPRDHEQVSCEIAREQLPVFGYTEPQIEQICGMIMATRIPQAPNNHLEQILCDADLDYLGRDDFYQIGNRLFEELSMYGIIHDEQEWNKLQIRFLESHRYFTPSAIKLRKEKKEQHLADIRSTLC